MSDTFRTRSKNFIAMISMLVLVAAPVAAEPNESPDILGRALGPFALTDFRGQVITQDDFADADVLVVAFLGVECPLAKLYTQRLVELRKQFADDRRVAFLGVDANIQDSLAELAAHVRRYEVSFPLAKDNRQKLADALGATRTPEVFVLSRDRVVQYYGRIDDQYGIGYVRDEPKTHQLRDAITQLLAGESVSEPHRPAVGCVIGRSKKPDASSPVTYSNQIARIFRDHCVQCHREGEIGPFALTEYEETVGWAEMILEVVEDRRMPPWHASPSSKQFVNDCSLTEQQIAHIRAWVEAGAPEGNPDQLPEPKHYVAQWQLPQEPDVIIDVSPEPFTVQAEGEVEYQYFRADAEFPEEKWILAAQLLPGNREVVHHILAFARPAGSHDGLGGERGFLVGYVPGSYAAVFPEGTAKRIPAGSELIFQVHYTPTGREQIDHSKLGIVFADPDTITHEVKTTSAVQPKLRVPPNEANYRVSAYSPPLPACQLLTMAPHMHLRGKSFRYTSLGPDGAREMLLDVPQYDFNWQTGYRLAEPLDLPAGSRIFCEAAFDNSEDNLNNPDPSKEVRWGDQTDDEMMIGYFDIVVPRKADLSARAQLIRDLKQRGNWSSLCQKFDRDRSGTIERKEVASRLSDRFDLLDLNQDGSLTEDEFEQ